ncbi:MULTISPECIES: efflux transporter outer membrane subunit [unclassified Parabacteroides]|uniref:efflux transporter outer membrane subunit n=1 Tax=unclassified Parabacteroides TaxID=2649774 RepID=UPI002475863C|nr:MULTISPECIES: efflux transporter outer membrane subunit [unclassified Parabacteroides]
MRKIIILSGVALLTGCSLYKPYSRPDNIRTEALYGADYETEDSVTLASMPWRELFTDPCLQALIEQGLKNNTDLQSAYLRVQQAEVTLKTARLAYLPSFNLAPNGGVASFDQSKGAWSYSVPLVASWDLDIFARITNNKRQAKSLYEQSDDYRQAVQAGLIVSISTQYYTLLMLDQQLDIAQETAVQFKESVRVMKAMKNAGMANEVGVSQMEAAWYSVESSVEELNRSIKEVENSLSAVLAEVPGTIVRGTLDEQRFPTELSTGVPLQLLTRRPDVRAAEQTLIQAYYATNIARASLYPSITLGGIAGWTNSVGSAIINPGKLLLNATGSLAQPIFNGGYNRGRVKIAKAQQEQAELSFQQTLLNAGMEVNNALTQYQTAEAKQQWRSNQIASLDKALAQTELLMAHTSTTYLDVLTARQSLLQAEMSMATDRFEQIQAVINLYHALGGGAD